MYFFFFKSTVKWKSIGPLTSNYHSLPLNLESMLITIECKCNSCDIYLDTLLNVIVLKKYIIRTINRERRFKPLKKS